LSSFQEVLGQGRLELSNFLKEKEERGEKALTDHANELASMRELVVRLQEENKSLRGLAV
jgi:hypothetical protein